MPAAPRAPAGGLGSALRDDLDSRQSDIDLVVEFGPLAAGQYADAYFGLLDGHRTLFGREVDPVMASAIRNPYFREAIERTERTLYAA